VGREAKQCAVLAQRHRPLKLVEAQSDRCYEGLAKWDEIQRRDQETLAHPYSTAHTLDRDPL